ncbi:MAG: hypothetical protein ACI4MJ_11630 [Aristaeellaceae bacterium]
MTITMSRVQRGISGQPCAKSTELLRWKSVAYPDNRHALFLFAATKERKTA